MQPDPTPKRAVQQAAENASGKRRLVAANSTFGLNLLAEAVKHNPDSNVFLSPPSVATVLTVLYAGAAGETQQAMAEALELGDMDRQEISQAYAALFESLENLDPKIQLTIANSIWAHEGIEFEPAFLDRGRKFFRTEIQMFNFLDPGAPAVINRWASQNTKGKITFIVQQLDPEIMMFLANALYFKGKWQDEFDRSLTRERAFHLPNGRQKLVPMMSQSGEYRYYRGSEFQAACLPFGEGRFSLYVFLPEPGLGLTAFLQQLDKSNWEHWMRSFRYTPGDILLPRYKLEYEAELRPMLQALGMEVAFDRQRASFAGVRAQRDVFIGSVAHKAVVEVNEEGAEAAAVTGMAVGASAMPEEPPERFTMIVDRPFFFAIRDNQTELVLFLGVVNEPK